MPRTIVDLTLANVNQRFLDAESKIDQVIQQRQFKIMSPWRSLIPRSHYVLGEGLSKKVYRFHAGMGPQRGLQDWHPIQISRKPSAGDPGYDSAKLNPHSVNYGFDSVTYSGNAIEYATEHINIRDIRFMWQMRQQLSAVYGYLGDFSNEVMDNYHREMYLYWMNNEANGVALVDGQFDTRAFTYDPFTADADGDNVLTTTGDGNIGKLDWDYFRQMSRKLMLQAPQAGIAMKGARPTFGWVGDVDDVERMVKGDSDLREDWRHHKASILIDNFAEVDWYDGFSIIHDNCPPRFVIKSYDGTTTTMKRVDPYTESNAALTGSRRDVNPEYLNAEFAIAIILLKDVFQTEMVPNGPTTAGAGTVFGAQPGYNGRWNWINNKDMQENPLGHLGYWLMMVEAFSKPLENREEAIAVLYRRKTHVQAADWEIGDPNTAGSRGIAVDAVAGDLDATNFTIALTLDGYLDVESGQAVLLTDDAAATRSGIVLDSSAAPTYIFALTAAATAAANWTQAGASTAASA